MGKQVELVKALMQTAEDTRAPIPASPSSCQHRLVLRMEISFRCLLLLLLVLWL
jgi:hypothetical protein